MINDKMMLIVAWDSLHDDFEMIIAPLFYSSNKYLKKIHLIITSTKAVPLTKQATGINRDLIMIAKK